MEKLSSAPSEQQPRAVESVSSWDDLHNTTASSVDTPSLIVSEEVLALTEAEAVTVSPPDEVTDTQPSRRAFLSGAAAFVAAAAVPASEAKAEHLPERTPEKLARTIEQLLPTELATIERHGNFKGKPILIGVPHIHFRDNYKMPTEKMLKVFEGEQRVAEILAYLASVPDLVDGIALEGMPQLNRRFSAKELELHLADSKAAHDEMFTGIPTDIRYAFLGVVAKLAKTTHIFGMEEVHNYLEMMTIDSALEFLQRIIADKEFRNKLLAQAYGEPPVISLKEASKLYLKKDDPRVLEVWRTMLPGKMVLTPQAFGDYQSSVLDKLEIAAKVKRHQAILDAMKTVPTRHTPPVIVLPLGEGHFESSKTAERQLPFQSIIADTLAREWNFIEVRPKPVTSK